ncbi:MAG: ankyrin repeat domain-containing protein [Burkholderiales bacterium]|jgi:hypothetical protein|nr:ankyrin repeat domain-containing protein [Burkholderiales bacterium]
MNWPRLQRRRVLTALLLLPILAKGKPMDPVNLKDPKTVYPDDAAMLELARLVLRDDARALGEALKKNPAAANTTGRHNVGLLLLAVANVRPDSVRVLMRAGADPFWPTSDISNLAEPAIYAQHRFTRPDMFTIMLEEGLDVNGGFEGEGTTLLKDAVLEADDRRLRQLIATGKVNVNLADSVQKTPLIIAINSTQYDKALLLLDAGADPRLGRWNVLEDLVNRHDKWAPGTPQDRDRKELIRRLRVLGMTETTPMQPAPQRPAGARHKSFRP